MKIYLVGLMASGKSSIGCCLANILKMDSIDIDTYFSQQDFRATNFRKLEAEKLTIISENDNVVISTGGGAVLDESSRQLMSRLGLVIYLKVSTVAQLQRLEHSDNSHRFELPLDLRAREIFLKKQSKLRHTLYASIADLIVDNDGNNISNTVTRIAAFVKAKIRESKSPCSFRLENQYT